MPVFGSLSAFYLFFLGSILLGDLVYVMAAGSSCPTCFGNLAGCSFSTDGGCPASKALSENVATVAAAAAATAVAAGTVFKLQDLISLRFLRMFTASSLSMVLRLISKPAAGTTFVLDSTTKLSAAFAAVRNGQATLEQVLVGYAELADDAAEEPQKVILRERYKMVCEARDMGMLASKGESALGDVGHWTFLWAKVSSFVIGRGMETSVTMEGKPASATTTSTTISIKSFTESTEFFEAMNLFMVFVTALGLVSSVILGEFFEYFVYDTIRLRGYGWEFASEFLFVVLRHIEDSAGRLNMVNAIHNVHLNTLLQEAESATLRRYPKVKIFRAHGGKPFVGINPDTSDKKPFNGKDSPNAKQCCIAFNTGSEHRQSNLASDGTCRFCHKCSNWVDNKGPKGQCMGNHAASACTNSNKCDQPKQ